MINKDEKHTVETKFIPISSPAKRIRESIKRAGLLGKKFSVEDKDEEIKREVKKWSWEFDKLLGYRITDNIEEYKAVHKFMEDVIKKTREQERESFENVVKLYFDLCMVARKVPKRHEILQRLEELKK